MMQLGMQEMTVLENHKSQGENQLLFCKSGYGIVGFNG